MPIICDRCKREVYRTEPCDYCGRKVGVECEKASQKASKVTRLVICKDCWSIMPRRAAYKNKHTMAQAARAAKMAAQATY